MILQYRPSLPRRCTVRLRMSLDIIKLRRHLALAMMGRQSKLAQLKLVVAVAHSVRTRQAALLKWFWRAINTHASRMRDSHMVHSVRRSADSPAGIVGCLDRVEYALKIQTTILIMFHTSVAVDIHLGTAGSRWRRRIYHRPLLRQRLQTRTDRWCNLGQAMSMVALSRVRPNQ